MLDDGTERRSTETDALTIDSDDDGTERRSTGTDALATDSDDGTADGEEDPDGDGLTHVEEVTAGTPPRAADIDSDGLSDPEELDAGTDPRATDTDDDFLRDGRELVDPFDTDPLDPDTDDDGILDGNKTYTTTAANDTLGAAVSLTGAGDVAAETSVESPQHARFTAGRAPAEVAASEFVDLESDAEFDTATVELAYDESQIETNESQLAVYRINESTDVYERLPSEVDAANDTIRASTEHFSVFVAVDIGAALDRLGHRIQLGTAPSAGGPDTIDYDFETSSPVVIPSGSSTTVNGNEWRCRNQPRKPPYSDTPTSGMCAIRGGKAYVQEETNRMRYLEHELSLPAVDSGEALFLDASLTGHLESEWSDAALRMVIESQSGEVLDVFRLKQNWDGATHTVSADPTVDITEYAGEDVRLSFRADGRWTYQFQNTMAWIEADSVTIERRGGASTDSDGDQCGDGRVILRCPALVVLTRELVASPVASLLESVAGLPVSPGRRLDGYRSER